MNILALDLGTKCGYSVHKPELSNPTRGNLSGVWNFAASRFDSHGQKFVGFKNALHEMFLMEDIKFVVYEEVRAHIAVDAAHSYGGFLAILQSVCLEHKVEYKGVPVGTIKKYATGKGNAKKPDMIVAASRLFPSINVIDDNHADALCLLSWATKNIIH